MSSTYHRYSHNDIHPQADSKLFSKSRLRLGQTIISPSPNKVSGEVDNENYTCKVASLDILFKQCQSRITHSYVDKMNAVFVKC